MHRNKLFDAWDSSLYSLPHLDDLDWTTEYKDLAEGVDHRFNLYLIYEF